MDVATDLVPMANCKKATVFWVMVTETVRMLSAMHAGKETAADGVDSNIVAKHSLQPCGACEHDPLEVNAVSHSWGRAESATCLHCGRRRAGAWHRWMIRGQWWR